MKFDNDVADPRSLYWTRGSERRGPFSPDELADELDRLGKVSVEIEGPMGRRWVLLRVDGNSERLTVEKLESWGLVVRNYNRE